MNAVLDRRNFLRTSALAAVSVPLLRSTWLASAQDATPSGGASAVAIADGPGDGEFTITHAQGDTVVKANPERIVSFDAASIDTLQTLGVELAGIPEISQEGKFDAEGIEVVGSMFEPDYEALNMLEPDLIIISGRTVEAYPDLSNLAPTIDLSFDASDMIGSLEANTNVLATLVGKQEEAASLLEDIKARVETLVTAAADVENGLVILTNAGAVTALAPANERGGRGALIYQTLGITPPVEDLEGATHGEPISFEFLLEHDPQWLFVIDRDVATGAEDAQPAAEVLDNEIMHQTRAWQDDHIVYLDPFDWYVITGAGLTSIERMLDELDAAFGA